MVTLFDLVSMWYHCHDHSGIILAPVYIMDMYSRRQALTATGLGIAALSGCTDLTEFAAGDGPLSETAQPARINEQTLSETGYSLAGRDTLEIDQEVDVGGETRRVKITNHIATYERPVDLSDALADDATSSDSIDADNVDQEDIPDDINESDIPDDVDPSDLQSTFGSGVTRPMADSRVDRSGQTTTLPQTDGVGTDSASSTFVAFTTPAFEILGQPLNPIGQMDNGGLATELADQAGQLSVGSEQATTTTTVLGSETTVSTFNGTLTVSGADVEIVVTSVINEDDYVIGFGAYPQLIAETESDNVSALLDGFEHPVSPPASANSSQ